MTDKNIELSPAELKALAREVVKEFLFEVGLRTDGLELIEEARRDFAFVRKFRQSTNEIASRIGWGVMGVLGTGFIYVLWEGIRFNVKGQ